MRKRLKLLVPVLGLLLLVSLAAWYLHVHPVAVLEPRGAVASKERNLFWFGLALSAVVVLPVFALLFGFAWKYREGNSQAAYTPELTGNARIESVWWVIPGLLILVLSVITWNSSHALDPFRPLTSKDKPLQVQVISLQWKWLFIYPEQHVATLNQLYLPVNRPVDLTLTSDAPMNSFWLPQLAGQIYTMPGMSTQLHLMANKTGTYRGQSANISGKGFAAMNFNAHVMTAPAFSEWLQNAERAPQQLNQVAYDQLAAPSTPSQPAVYSAVLPDMYDRVVMKYMMPGHAAMEAMP